MASSTRELKDIATALIGLARDQKVLPETLVGLGSVRDALVGDLSLLRALTDTVVPLEERQNGLKAALKGSVDNLVTNTLLVLQRDGLLMQIDSFYTIAKSVASERANHRHAEVTSAITLSATERQSIERALIERFGGTIELSLLVDPAILGGFVVKVDGWIYDASLKNTTRRLATALATP